MCEANQSKRGIWPRAARGGYLNGQSGKWRRIPAAEKGRQINPWVKPLWKSGPRIFFIFGLHPNKYGIHCQFKLTTLCYWTSEAFPVELCKPKDEMPLGLWCTGFMPEVYFGQQVSIWRNGMHSKWTMLFRCVRQNKGEREMYARSGH